MGKVGERVLEDYTEKSGMKKKKLSKKIKKGGSTRILSGIKTRLRDFAAEHPKGVFIFLLILVSCLGFLLRSNNLYTWPRLGATFDEYAWTWQGMSLIQKGTPTSWSPHPQYKSAKEIKYQTVPFRIVTPYLEHPPVFGLVAGSYAILNGARSMFDVNLFKIRGLSLILGTISVFLVGIFASQAFGRKTGILSSILYATIPTIAVGSRLVQNENFFIPLFFLALISLNRFLRTKKGKWRNIAAVICGLLILSKIPFIAAAVSVVFILFYLKRYKDILLFLAIVIPMSLLFFLYGIYYDKQLFFSLWGLQLNRYDLGFTSIYAIIQKPFLADRYYLDGWVYVGFASILLLFSNFKKYVILLLPFLAYFLIFLAGIPDEAGHGWYRYPMYPFLAIAIAIFVFEYYLKNAFLTFLFLLGVGLALFQNTWVQMFGFSYFVFRTMLIIWGLVLIPPFIPKFSKMGKIVGISSLVLFFVLNVWSILVYNEQ